MVKEKLKQKKSVLVISEVFYPEEFLINDVVKKWANNSEYEVKVLTRNPSYPFGKVFSGYYNKIYQRSKYFNANIHRYHVIQGYKNNTKIKILNYLWNALLSTIIAVLKFRKEKNIFVYHTGPLTVAFAGVILKKINGGKLTIWTQDIWPETIFAYGIKKYRFTERWVKKYVAWIYRNCDHIMVSSESFRKTISQYVDTDIQFVPNWVNSVFTDPIENTKRNDDFNFTFAGNVGKVQNLETVIDCFDNWQRTKLIQNAILNVYGDGSNLEVLKSRVKEKSIKNVKFWGRVPISEMPKIYKKSDVLIISLKQDSIFRLYLPAKFSSYLSSGKPILGIIGGDVKMLIEKYGVGYAANPNDINLIVNGFDHLYNLTDSELKDIKIKSKNLLSDFFDEEKNIKVIELALWGDEQ